MHNNLSTKSSIAIAVILLIGSFLFMDVDATHNLGGFQNVTRSSILASSLS